MSWAAIAKTPVKPTPVNTEVLALATPPLLSPLSPTALSPPQALSPTSPYAKFGFPSSTGMPLGPQAIPLGSLGPKPMSSPATGSWAAKAKPIVGLPNWTGPVSSGPQLAAPMAIPRPGAPTVAQPPPGTAGPVIKKDLPMSLANKGINPKLFNIRPEHVSNECMDLIRGVDRCQNIYLLKMHSFGKIIYIYIYIRHDIS